MNYIIIFDTSCNRRQSVILHFLFSFFFVCFLCFFMIIVIFFYFVNICVNCSYKGEICFCLKNFSCCYEVTIVVHEASLLVRQSAIWFSFPIQSTIILYPLFLLLQTFQLWVFCLQFSLQCWHYHTSYLCGYLFVLMMTIILILQLK